MAWVPFAAAPGGGVAATLTTHNNPAPAAGPPANRSCTFLAGKSIFDRQNYDAPFIGSGTGFSRR